MNKTKLISESTAMEKEVIKRYMPSKALYKQKYNKPLKGKRKNEYDSKEEARYNHAENINNSFK